MRTIDKNSFFKHTNGRFQECAIPTREADFVSKTTWGEISSIYYFENNGVIRVSNHWGAVASCQWNLNTVNEFGYDKCRKTEVKAGFITFAELEQNTNLGIELLEAISKGQTELANEIKLKLNGKY